MTDNKDSQSMEVLNVEQAATYLFFSTNYIYRLAKEKLIPHISFGRHILFRKSDLYNWLGSKVVYEPEVQEA